MNSEPLAFLDIRLETELKSLIVELGVDFEKLAPIVPKILERAKVEAGGEVVIGDPIEMVIRVIERHCLSYIRGVLGQGRKWKKAREEIRSWGSVFLVGAGFSFESGMPLGEILESLLKFAGGKNWEELRLDKDKVLVFQREFKRTNDGKKPGDSHILVARNFSEHHIEEIICTNWDNLIERAYRDLIGRDIPKINEEQASVSGSNYLWKLHGDVENVNNKKEFVLPDEGGRVFKCFVEYVNRVKQKMFAFIIVGYSEGDKKIYDQIINKFQQRRPTYRVGMDLEHLDGNDEYIVGPSDFVLQKILPISS